jgi:hypothetical protein
VAGVACGVGARAWVGGVGGGGGGFPLCLFLFLISTGAKLKSIKHIFKNIGHACGAHAVHCASQVHVRRNVSQPQPYP